MTTYTQAALATLHTADGKASEDRISDIENRLMFELVRAPRAATVDDPAKPSLVDGLEVR